MPTAHKPQYHRNCFICTPQSKREAEWISDPKVSDPERSRTFVLCFDGTGDSPDDDDSNVLQFVTTLKDDRTEQVVYYQPGIGTSTKNLIKTPAREIGTKLVDQMFAYSIGDHIKEGYKFLMEHYQAGDKICIFGFSRGAYTARALAGMLQKVGLLPPSKFNQLDEAYNTYEDNDKKVSGACAEFKQTSIDVKVGFLGVWDTVESVGVNSKSLPFSRSNHTVKVFRQALALDERRVKFKPSFCTKPKNQQANSNAVTEKGTDVKEVFFAGAHSDVGGGSVKNGTRHSLARIPLRWMIRECFTTHTGIIFDAHMLEQVGLDINSIDKAPELRQNNTLPLEADKGFSVTSELASPFVYIWNKLPQIRTPRAPPPWIPESEAQEELKDALSPIYDQLVIHPFWQAMELWYEWQADEEEEDDDDSGKSGRGHRFQNLGQGRRVPKFVMERGLKVHRSVKARILAHHADGKEGGYLPKIRCKIEGEEEPRLLTRDEWLAGKYFTWVD